jgi:hypothetical protein
VPATIVGVVQDSRFRSIREPIEPIMFYDGTQTNGFAGPLRRRSRRIRDGLERCGSGSPRRAVRRRIREDRVAELYEPDESRAKIFAGFAAARGVIACLGLFGLAAFTAERRTKEIGIRKVLGARTRDIVRLLAWQFSKPVLVANLIAWPVAWWVMRDWLNGFDAGSTLGPRPSSLAGCSRWRSPSERSPATRSGSPGQSDPRPPLRVGARPMWRNYLTVGFRALAKNKTYAFINIFGLAIGMAACLMILLYVRYEMSYDRWLPEAERLPGPELVQVERDRRGSQLQMTPYRRGAVARKDFPQIEKRSTSSTTIRSSSRTGQATSTEDYLWVDENFLDVVPLPLVRGDRARSARSTRR